MFHALKKKRAQRTAAKRGVIPSAEFLDYKQRLEGVKRNMELVDTNLTEANANWSRYMIEQRSFSEKFVEGYPNSADDTHRIAGEFADGSRALYDYFVRYTTPEIAEYHRMHDQVKAYIAEINEVEAMYPGVLEARSETARYQDKVDSIETSKKESKTKKKFRNVQKMDNEREKYEELTCSVIVAQKKTYAKAPIVHKIGLCAYWLSNEIHVTMATKSLEKTAEFARTNTPELSRITVAALDIPESPVAASHSPVVVQPTAAVHASAPADPTLPAHAPASPAGVASVLVKQAV